MIKNTKYIFVVFSIVLSFNISGYVHAEETDYKIIDPNEVSAVLDMIASVTQANFEKIQTWQGRISKETTNALQGELAARLFKKHTGTEPNILPDVVHQITHRMIEYDIDIKNNRFYSFYDKPESTVYVDPKNNTMYPSHWSPPEQRQILTAEYRIEIGPLKQTKNGTILTRMARKEKAGMTRVTDPRKRFYNGGEMLWLSFSRFSEYLQAPETETYGVVFKEKSTGDRTTYRMEVSEPGKEQPFSVIVLSSDAGFNRTLVENWYDDGSLMSQIDTEFVSHQGIYLPKRWTSSQYFQGGGLRYREVCTIENQQINTSIPENVFSEFTYLQDGDMYKDDIQGKRYTVKAGKLLEESK